MFSKSSLVFISTFTLVCGFVAGTGFRQREPRGKDVPVVSSVVVASGPDGLDAKVYVPVKTVVCDDDTLKVFVRE